MRHDLVVEGSAFRLRPVEVSDAEFMVRLRKDEALSRYLNETSGAVSDQQEYIRGYFDKEDDIYFIVERRDGLVPQGMVAIYDIKDGRAEWGRWILKEGSLAALESAYLIYVAAFEFLKLDGVYCRTIQENQKVVSFHESCGLQAMRSLPGYAKIKGKAYDSIEQELTADNWILVKQVLLKKVSALSALMRRK